MAEVTSKLQKAQSTAIQSQPYYGGGVSGGNTWGIVSPTVWTTTNNSGSVYASAQSLLSNTA